MSFLQRCDTLVCQLRVRSAGLDPLTARLRAQSLLNHLGLQPSGLPPATLVCIRRLRIPRHGLLCLHHGSVRPSHAWGNAVQAALDELVRGAARPALGAVPASAEAVLFADRAELSACLLSDWFDGCAHTRWWWQGLFHGADLAGAAMSMLLEAPAYLPAIFQKLADQGLAVSLAQSFSAENARILLRGLSDRFALPIDSSPVDPSKDDAYEETTTILECEPTHPSTTLHGEPRVDRKQWHAAPWQPHVPEADLAGLSVEAQAVLGVSLLLQRAPSIVRQPAFVKNLNRWWRAKQELEAKVPPAISSETGRSGRPGNATDNAAMGRHEQGGALSPATRNGTDAVPAVASAFDPPPSSVRPVLRPAPAANSMAPDFILRGTEPVLSTALPAGIPTPQAHSWAMTPIETELGGLFYLANLGLFLNLYGDFTTPARPGISLSLWDFISLLGHELLDGTRKADPVWLLLAQLAGRDPDQRPGHDFDPPDAWRMPADWLTPFGRTNSWQWSMDSGRLRVQHEQGLTVLDVPLTERLHGTGDCRVPPRQLTVEMRGFAQDADLTPQCRSRDSETPIPSRLDWWLGLLMPYVRARLRRALGLADGANLAGLLCENAARVFVTASHLDITFSLAELPIAVRLSGLDRDPGWVPAAGRFIQFHYS